MKITRPLLVLALLMALGVGIYAYSGAYPVGADEPHAGPTLWLLATVRDRGIASQSRSVTPPPDLNSPQRLSIGAGQYASMCSGCHLAPGYQSDETWEGLYPQPPRLAQGIELRPAEVFWVVKHGLKFSGMPAWGKSHSDDEIWDLAAFVLKLQHLTPAQYKDFVAHAPRDKDMLMMPMPGGDTMD